MVKVADLEKEAGRSARKEAQQRSEAARKAEYAQDEEEDEPACATCGLTEAHTEDGKMSYCAGCHRVQYCSKACQKKHWDWVHKDECTGRAHVQEKVDVQSRQEAAKEKARKQAEWEQQQEAKRDAQRCENERLKEERARELDEEELDPLEELSAWLVGLGVKVKDADKYAATFTEDGYETMAALAAQSPEQLQKMGVRRKDIDNILQAAAVAAWQEQQEKQATVPPAAEPKAETEPMTEAVDISSMSVKELKAYITRKGLSHADCCEKSELQARARGDG